MRRDLPGIFGNSLINKLYNKGCYQQAILFIEILFCYTFLYICPGARKELFVAGEKLYCFIKADFYRVLQIRFRNLIEYKVIEK